MFNLYDEYQIGRDNLREAERRAERAWRFRHVKPKYTQVATRILTAVLAFLLR